MQITIDFWQTLYDTANGTERNEGRRSALFTAIAAENEAPDLREEDTTDITDLEDADVATSGVEKLTQAFPGAEVIEEPHS